MKQQCMLSNIMDTETPRNMMMQLGHGGFHDCSIQSVCQLWQHDSQRSQLQSESCFCSENLAVFTAWGD